jgi:hypothetical protein
VSNSRPPQSDDIEVEWEEEPEVETARKPNELDRPTASPPPMKRTFNNYWASAFRPRTRSEPCVRRRCRQKCMTTFRIVALRLQALTPRS